MNKWEGAFIWEEAFIRLNTVFVSFFRPVYIWQDFAQFFNYSQ